MRTLRDYAGLSIRITDERLAHVLQHPEMTGLESAIEETLASPERVVRSLVDPDARLYDRFYRDTRVGDTYVCVVVKSTDDAFLVTAYLTDRVKSGVQLWPHEA